MDMWWNSHNGIIHSNENAQMASPANTRLHFANVELKKPAQNCEFMFHDVLYSMFQSRQK